ncbi:hypothetical protein GN157_06555 [Flavobacterium rakeshii]|uniref:Uncharacterized protein n=1 Tax=Flavobacterium rakeshii TaxID=1038845 RepID=A0A6N8HEF4_9FLAO|nr:hypothetical protein [Flavobacterium rakeshii]MUV03367.1 hypothetical protein [Flavobacterium rakeshii]
MISHTLFISPQINASQEDYNAVRSLTDVYEDLFNSYSAHDVFMLSGISEPDDTEHQKAIADAVNHIFENLPNNWLAYYNDVRFPGGECDARISLPSQNAGGLYYKLCGWFIAHNGPEYNRLFVDFNITNFVTEPNGNIMVHFYAPEMKNNFPDLFGDLIKTQLLDYGEFLAVADNGMSKRFTFKKGKLSCYPDDSKNFFPF